LRGLVPRQPQKDMANMVARVNEAKRGSFWWVGLILSVHPIWADKPCPLADKVCPIEKKMAPGRAWKRKRLGS